MSHIAGFVALALLTLVRGDGRAPALRHVLPTVAATVSAPATAVVAPGAPAQAPSAALPIAGWIVDSYGSPIAGVRVTRRGVRAAGDGSAASDAMAAMAATFAPAAPAASAAPAATEAPPATAVSDELGAFRMSPSSEPVQQLVLDAPHVFPSELVWRASDPVPRILLARRVHLEARVIAAGAPVAGAEVQLSDGSGPAIATAVTDRDGIARFRDLVPGPYELWAREGARVSPLARIADAAEARDLLLALEPAGTVRGQVTADGPLPAGGTVQLSPLDLDHAPRTAALDAQGRFAIAGLPRGRWRVEISVPDHFAEGERVLDARGAVDELLLRVARAGIVSGTVVDPAGAPVAGATIVLRLQGAGAPVVRPVAERPALAPSRLRWVHPLAGPRAMPVIAPARFGAHRPGHRAAECGLGHCGVDIGNKRGTIVHAAADGDVIAAFTDIRGEAGRFVAIDHGGGLRTLYMHLDELRAGLEVGQKIRAGDPLGTIGTTGFALEAPHLHFALTQDHHGRTWYVDPEPMLRHAVVLAAPRPLDPIDAGAPAGAGRVAVIAATPRRELPGPVPAAGASAAGAGAEPAARTFVSDAKGQFRLEGVAPGSYVAVAFADGFAPVASAPFTVKSGAETDGVTIALRPGVLVFGRVTGRDGPVDGATITAAAGLGETAHKVALTYTTRTGEFSLRALTGKITLTVSASGYGDVDRAITLDDTNPSRARQREDFALVIEDGQLRGQVLAPDGGAADGISVRVIEGPSRRSAVTDALGQFALDRVASGSYLVEVTSAEHPPLRARLATGTWKELRLLQGGALRVRLSDARSGAPLASVRVEATGPGGQTASRTTDLQGVADLRALAAGEWTVSVRAPGYTAARRAIAVAATRVPPEVRLDLLRSATVAGVVRDRFGRRVAGARVSLGGVTARTEDDGSFRIADAPAGPGTLEAEHEGARGALRVELRPGDERLSLTIELAE
ncbi:MAG TPA: carboxypeptidase regulatory-like domain-containing protein [Kofleriaceae bacterium]|nr:carboxypeptidase regulatory-like domain-containing protein [Kofleriaceae bacterium]